jgi:hypothetical protein
VVRLGTGRTHGAGDQGSRCYGENRILHIIFAFE